ncbi:MAG: hypothetical protein ACQKBW_08950 [Puniceicoccales bacterium]
MSDDEKYEVLRQAQEETAAQVRLLAKASHDHGHSLYGTGQPGTGIMDRVRELETSLATATRLLKFICGLSVSILALLVSCVGIIAGIIW